MPFLPSHPQNAGPPTVYQAYPDIYAHWSQMSQALMNGASPISQGERELILAYAAGLLGCDYVCRAHSHVADAWGMPLGLAHMLLEGRALPDLPVKLQALLAVVRKLAQTPSTLTGTDIDDALDAGWDEKAVHDAVAIVARAAFMHRLIAGMGFEARERGNPQEHARRRIEKGYFALFDFKDPR
jgi:alkylhydroperoxidase family enzyme